MLDLTKENFEEEVLKAEGYVFVDFYGDGCVPCQALMPKVHEFADTYGDKMKFTSLNTTKARRLAIAQKVLGLPVMACLLYTSPFQDYCRKSACTVLSSRRGSGGGRAGFGPGGCKGVFRTVGHSLRNGFSQEQLCGKNVHQAQAEPAGKQR